MMTYRYAPEFQVDINGETIPAVLRASISDVRWTSALEGADRVELTIANERLRWLDHDLLQPDSLLELAVGYAPDGVTKVFTGEIVSVDATFPSSGIPTLTVAAQDYMHRLQKGTKSRWFAIPVPSVGNLPMPDMMVGSLVSLEHGLIPAFDPVGAAIAVIVGQSQALALVDGANEVQKLIRRQNGVSDFDFLKRISQENGWEMLIDHEGATGGSVLRFMSPLDQLSPSLELTYGASLIDFTPRITNVGQIASVTVNIWESHLKIGFKVTVGWDWEEQSLTVSIVPSFGGVGGQASAPAESSATSSGLTMLGENVTKANAAKVILSKLIPRLNRRQTGTGSAVGDPKIRAGRVLKLTGLGATFGGYYRVTETTHSIGQSGYRTSFQVRKDIWFSTIPAQEQGAVPVSL